jgi:hypothetical protein
VSDHPAKLAMSLVSTPELVAFGQDGVTHGCPLPSGRTAEVCGVAQTLTGAAKVGRLEGLMVMAAGTSGSLSSFLS